MDVIMVIRNEAGHIGLTDILKDAELGYRKHLATQPDKVAAKMEDVGVTLQLRLRCDDQRCQHVRE